MSSSLGGGSYRLVRGTGLLNQLRPLPTSAQQLPSVLRSAAKLAAVTAGSQGRSFCLAARQSVHADHVPFSARIRRRPPTLGPPTTEAFSRRFISSSCRRQSSAELGTSAKPYYVTTPIFYVNADPHIGHLHSCLVADVLARWSALRRNGMSEYDRSGSRVPEAELEKLAGAAPLAGPVFSTGTDEHGLKIQRVAEALGENPKALCDRVSERFKDLADAANIEYSRFIRTTEDAHVRAVHHLWGVLKDKGLIYKDSYEGWYAVSDEAFYPEGQVHEVIDEKTGEKHMASIETGAKVEWSSEENYKFKLSAFQDDLIRWIESGPEVLQPAQRRAEVLQELKSGLSDLSISRPRSRLSWGIPVPDDPEHSIYVWVDALTNYLTVTGYPWANGSADSGLSPVAWPADVHVVGKDIVRFHAVYWPAMLLGAGLPLPRTILAHSHWIMNKAKMSKSKGNVADPFEALKEYGIDTIRFFLMRSGGNFSFDADYSAAMVLETYRTQLKNQYGNLLSRISAPKIQARISRFAADGSNKVDRLPASSVMPLLDPALQSRIAELEQALISLPNKVDELMRTFQFRRALDLIVEDVNGRTAELWHALTPWSGDVADEVVLEAVVLAYESLRMTGTLLRPFMPHKMDEMFAAMQVEPERRSSWKALLQLEAPDRLKATINLRPANLPKVKPLFPALAVES